MDSQQFRILADQCFRRIGKALDGEDPDDVEVYASDGVVTLEFGDSSKFMVSRQSATNQIWVAAGARAWHYNYDEAKNTWVDDRDGHDLYQRLSELISQKIGHSVDLSKS
ncbi:MAG: iron donor protein CyaY [Planctomycetota bacterium]